jgi:hypothetical protein
MYKLEESNNQQWMDVIYRDPAVFKYTKLDLQISPPHE